MNSETEAARHALIRKTMFSIDDDCVCSLKEYMETYTQNLSVYGKKPLEQKVVPIVMHSY